MTKKAKKEVTIHGSEAIYNRDGIIARIIFKNRERVWDIEAFRDDIEPGS
jgi:hypothetical protein